MIRIRIETSERFEDYAREKRYAAAQAVTAAVNAATEGFKTELRQQLARAFPTSGRAPNIVGSKVFPRAPKFSFGAAGTVFPRGKPGSSAYLILDAFSRGATITPKNGQKSLAIPTQYVPTARSGAGGVSSTTGRRATTRMTPVEVEAHFNQDLDFLPAHRGNLVGFLVLRGVKGRRRGTVRAATPRRLAQGRRQESIVMFILVRRAKLPKLLDPDALAQKWAGELPDLIDRAIPRDF